jgi:transposase
MGSRVVRLRRGSSWRCAHGRVLIVAPEDHLVWTVLGAVDQMNLDGFYGAYRANAQGRAAYDPARMVALLIYSYSRRNLSSRGIERGCHEDVALKAITALRVSDHSTIPEFRGRHERALAGVFSQVLALCREAGLVLVGVIAVDGTTVAANASKERNLEYRRLVVEILAEAESTDQEEDRQFGDKRGDELPLELACAAGRQRALRQAKQRLQQQEDQHEQPQQRERSEDESAQREDQGSELVLRFDREVIERASGRGRRRCFVEAQKQLDEQRRREAEPIPRSRSERLVETERRMREQLDAELQANWVHEEYIAGGVTPAGVRFKAKPSPYVAPQEPVGKMNITDPDSRVMRTTTKGWIQGYNAQAAVNENHIVIPPRSPSSHPTSGTSPRSSPPSNGNSSWWVSVRSRR